MATDRRTGPNVQDFAGDFVLSTDADGSNASLCKSDGIVITSLNVVANIDFATVVSVRIDGGDIYATTKAPGGNGASTEQLLGTVATVASVNAKQDTIADLTVIRSGAAEGATATQPGDFSITGDVLTTPAGPFTGGGGGFTDVATGEDLSYDSDATIAEATASNVDPNTIFETDAPTEVVTVLPREYGGTGLNQLSTLVQGLIGATSSAQVLDLLGIDTTGTPGAVTKASVDAVLGVPDADVTDYYNGDGFFTPIRARSPDGTLWELCVTDEGNDNWKLTISPFTLLDVSDDPFTDVNDDVMTAIPT